MMIFSFRPRRLILRAAHRRVREDAGGFLEGGRADERLGRQARLRDPQQDRLRARRPFAPDSRIVLRPS